MHLAELRPRHPNVFQGRSFPFDVPAIRTLRRIAFDRPVTFFVGENGSGKSTLLEGLASAIGIPAIGSHDVERDPTLVPARALGEALALTWTHRTARGFFLRAEDFFGFAKRLSRERTAMLQELAAIEAEYRAADRSDWALGLAQGPLRNSLADMEQRYGIDLDANSHGQAFLRLFQNRFVPGGLYLIDEPEAALSPQSQLALLAMLFDMVRQDAQFVIATHSPLILAYPGARIYAFDDGQVRRVEYDELEHVRVMRDFLRDPEAYLRHLQPDSPP